MAEVSKGSAFVVSGPSGVGKSSLLRQILKRDANTRFSVSHTTRPPRPGEENGSDYFFVDEPEFRAMIDRDVFLEWAEYQGNLYGTSHEAVLEPTRAGFDLILEVEVQGARLLRDRLQGAKFVFIIPPSLDALENRLRGRGSDGEDVMQKRLERAHEELREIQHYDYVVVNESLDQAVDDLLLVIAASRHERGRVLPFWRTRLNFGGNREGGG